MKSNKLNVIRVTLLAIAILVFQQLSSKFAAFFSDRINYAAIDIDNSYAVYSVHHIIQMVVVLIVILIIAKIFKIDFYLKPKKSKIGNRYLLIFTITFLVLTVIAYVIGYMNGTWGPAGFELNARNVLGTLGFQFFLSGSVEEIIFRAFPIAILSHYIVNRKYKTTVPIIVASVFFVLAHVNWSLNPFSISYDWFQLVLSLTLGTVYGFAYVKSKSVIYPMLLHSISNVLMTGCGYLFQVLWK